MNYKRLTSLFALTSFLMISYTGTMLYLCPPGRVAYWNDWTLLGLTKTKYGDLHILFSLMFIIAAIFHIYYNWKSILLYLKNSAKKVIIFTKETSIALILTFVIFGGTYFKLPPFSLILDLNEYIGDSWSKKLGEPPYGHAELSTLSTFFQHLGVDSEESLTKLKNSGLKNVSTKITIKDLAKTNDLKPSDILNLLVTKGNISKLPTNNLGHGHMSFEAVCKKEKIYTSKVIKKLSLKFSQQIDKKDNFKAVAKQLNLHPQDLLILIKTE